MAHATKQLPLLNVLHWKNERKKLKHFKSTKKIVNINSELKIRQNNWNADWITKVASDQIPKEKKDYYLIDLIKIGKRAIPPNRNGSKNVKILQTKTHSAFETKNGIYFTKP